jgi:hypothetical protein
MTTDTQKLAADIERVMELDAKRTPGEWSWENPNKRSYGDAWVNCDAAEKIAVCGDISMKIDWGYCGRAEPELVEDNAAFIATAPQMAAIIAQLWAEREQQRAVMVQAKEALGSIDGHGLARTSPMREEQRKQALALAKPLLGKREGV